MLREKWGDGVYSSTRGGDVWDVGMLGVVFYSSPKYCSSKVVLGAGPARLLPLVKDVDPHVNYLA